MIRISAVSYLNTLPFIHGMEHSGFLDPSRFILNRDIPSVCASRFESRTADIVLVPVAALAGRKDYEIITGFCIGATRNVASVLLVSQCPLSEIKNVYLDYQSRTSVNLVKVLASHHWKKNFTWLNATPGYEQIIEKSTAGVIIGDRALEYSGNYKYCYDLADAWNDFTGLPFVFACWVLLRPVSEDDKMLFHRALKWGIDHVHEIHPEVSFLSELQIQKYFTENIEYQFDERKRMGLSKFLGYLT